MNDHLTRESLDQTLRRLAKLAAGDDAKESRHEKGKSVDPTKDMSPEDAAEWEKQTEKNKDKFKSAFDASERRLQRLADDEKESRHEEGKSVDPTKDMSPEDAAEWKENTEKNKDKFKSAGVLEERWGRTARTPGGLYGYTKRTQQDAEVSIRKLSKSARKLARYAYKKDPRVAQFLVTHAKRSKTPAARILVGALQEIGPRVAREMVAALKGEDKQPTPGKEASYGMYGYRSKTASLGLNACMSLRDSAGTISAGLHRRRSSKHANLTGFFDAHCKEGRCLYARLLRNSYPDVEMRLASVNQPSSVESWLTWED